MTHDVTAYGGTIDQRGMTAGERFELACILREAWWDCYGIFMNEVVEVSDTGLLPRTLVSLADDLDEAGYTVHAAAVREMAAPSRPHGIGIDRAPAARHARPHRALPARAVR